MACAPTGSGKTLAFVLPLLHHLREPRSGGVRALVLSPTKELAEQVCILIFIRMIAEKYLIVNLYC